LNVDFFEEANWEKILTDSIMETAFREETRPTPPSELALKNRKIVEKLKTQKLELVSQISDKKRVFSRAIAQANSLGITWAE